MARSIPLKLERQEERRALAELALREYRKPADQAAWLVIKGLRDAGLLDRPDDDRQQEPAVAS